MPNGILDPNDFTIAPGDMRSLQDRMLELRRSLPPSLQGQQVSGQPQQTQPEQMQGSLVKQILSQAPGFLAQADVQSQAQETGEKPKTKSIDERNAEMQKLVNQGTNPFAPKESIGSPFIGKLLHGQDEGGILGTGIQPLDVLAFALGAAITSKMPQDKAIATTMMFAKMPSEFRKNQADSADNFIKRQLAAANAATGMTNAATSQMQAAKAQQEFESGYKVADLLEKAGKPAEAEAFRANRVNDYMKIIGGDETKIPTVAFVDHLRGMASGAIPVPDWYMKRTGSKSPEEAKKRAMAEYEAKLLELAPIPTATGAVMRTPSGMQEVPAQPRGIRDISRELESDLGGGQAQAPIASMPVPQEPVRRLVPTPGGGFMPPTASRAPAVPPETPYVGSGQLLDQLSKSPSKQDQWVAKYHSDTPAEVQVKMSPLFQKPIDAGDRQKLVAQASALNFGEKLLDKYDNMIASVGGEKNMKFTGNMKRYINELSTRISAEGATASMLGIAADFASAWSQRGKQKFTPEEEDFMAHYAQAQSYARGAMQDAANLATRERDMFRNMIGTLLDTPSMYRARVGNFLSNIGDNYNTLLKANKLKASDGFEHYSPPKLTKEPPKWFRPLVAPKTPVQPGGEY